MSNDLAIATVTRALQHILQTAFDQGDLAGVKVVTRRPNKMDSTDDKQVNLYLYQAAPNTAWRNADLPTRRPNGTLAQAPQVALDLYYLLSFYGNEEHLVPQR